MINWMEYAEIQKHKRAGLNKSQVARLLSTDYKTILKYWDMSPDDFSAERENASSRRCKADAFKNYILKCLTEYPDMSSAQLYDWLKENSGNDTLPFTERTMRNYVNHIREEYDITRPQKVRQYEAVEELPMGFQAQVDMGSINLKNYYGRSKKVFCFAMVLSHSRYKYVLWQDRPFTTSDFTAAHIKAFAFFGGRPKQIVYDQDRVMTVSENYGDIIYTSGFQSFVNEIKFEIYLCRGADPESKGKVENVVKYAKHNFAEHRVFYDIDSFNQDCIDWLRRTANGTINDTTKKIPAEVFSVEKEYLIPVSECTNVNSDTKSILYSVRKDNVVLYKSNRYRVPYGTYAPGRKVALYANNRRLRITDPETGEILAVYDISSEKGKLIGEKVRHNEKPEVVLQTEQELKALFDYPARFDDFLKQVEATHMRHYKDQLFQLKKLFEVYDKPVILESFEYCITHSLFSYADMNSCILFFNTRKEDPLKKRLNAKSLPEKYRNDKIALRDLSIYEEALSRRD